MPRYARIVAPKHPHHIIQRGNRKLPVFFKPHDYQFYINTLKENCDTYEVDIWSYCLMPNHVHLIAVPHDQNGLSKAISETHKKYSWTINRREGWTGHLWQGRFQSYVMDEPHCLMATRYIALNPVKAGLVKKAEDYPWSSAATHMFGKPDVLVRESPLDGLVTNWREYLSTDNNSKENENIIQHSQSGKPLGADHFIKNILQTTGHPFTTPKMGRPRKTKAAS